MTENEYRAMIDQLIQACLTLGDCWTQQTGLRIQDDPFVEDAMSVIESVRAELTIYDQQCRIEMELKP